MKKLLILCLMVALVLIGTAPISATPVADLTSLAQYVPADVPFFMAIRADDDYFESLDSLLTEVNPTLNIAPPNTTLRSALDDFAQDQFDGDFETAIRPWLGNTFSMAFFDVSEITTDNPNFEDLKGMIAFEITDSSVVERKLNNDVDLTIREQVNEGIVYYTDDDASFQGSVYLTDEVLIFLYGFDDPMAVVPDFEESLADSDAFQSALGRLPDDEYDTILYLDYANMGAVAKELQSEIDSDFPFDIDFVEIFSAIGGQAMGAKVVDRSLVLDIATQIQDTDALQGMGFNPNSVNPLSLDFTNQLPADTMLVLQDTNFGERWLNALEEAYQLGEQFEDKIEAGELDRDLEGLAYLDEAVTFVRLSFKGLAGLSMDEAFGWMTGDYALYANLVPYNGLPVDGETPPMLPEFGLIATASDSDSATMLVDGIETLLFELGFDTVREDSVLVLPIIGDILEFDSWDLLLVQDGDRLIAGTRGGVSSAMTAGGLSDTDAFQNASATFLADTQSLAYINMQPFIASVSMLADALDDRDLQQAVGVLTLFESASITSHLDDEANGVVRLVLTLNSK